MTSKEFMDSFRNEFKKEKFHIIKEKFDEGYDFALCFEVKETKDWKYGIWFLFDEKQKEKVNSLQFFARHKDDLDKFKPSRSHYCREINIENSVKIEEWELASCIEMVKQIKTHPFLSYESDIGYSFYPYGNLFFKYIKNRIFYKIKKFKEWHKEKDQFFNLTWQKMKIVKRKAIKYYSDCFSSFEIIDKNSGGLCCYPRFKIRATWNCPYNDGYWLEPVADLFYKANGDEVFKGSKCWVEYKNNDKDDTYSIYLGEEEIEKFYGWKYRLFKKKK